MRHHFVGHPATILTSCDGRQQETNDNVCRVLTLQRTGALQRERVLCFSVRYGGWTGWEYRPTRQCELVLFGGLINIEKFLKVDYFASMTPLRPW